MELAMVEKKSLKAKHDNSSNERQFEQENNFFHSKITLKSAHVNNYAKKKETKPTYVKKITLNNKTSIKNKKETIQMWKGSPISMKQNIDNPTGGISKTDQEVIDFQGKKKNIKKSIKRPASTVCHEDKRRSKRLNKKILKEDINLQKVEELLEILVHVNGTVKFLVRWKGLGQQYDTWEDVPKLMDLNSGQLMLEFIKKAIKVLS